MLLDLDRYDITELLQDWNRGDLQARNALFDLVYAPLRRTAQQVPRPGRTVSVSALVHEAFLRLSGSESAQFHDRTHFAATCVRVLRFLAIDQYRRAQVREDHAAKQPPASLAADGDSVLQRLDLQGALAELDGQRPEAAEAVTLRYWGGLQMEEVAAQMDCSLSKARRRVRAAEFFLRTRLYEATQEE